MVDRENLLTSKEMAEFVAAGFLRFDKLVPDELNRAALAEIESGEVKRSEAGTRFSTMWCDLALGKVFRAKLLHHLARNNLPVPDDLPTGWVVHCDMVGNGLPRASRACSTTR